MQDDSAADHIFAAPPRSPRSNDNLDKQDGKSHYRPGPDEGLKSSPQFSGERDGPEGLAWRPPIFTW
jgi:hypothetical protein